MANVKRQKRQRKLAFTVVEMCRRLGLPRKPLTQRELHQLLKEVYGAEAPSLRTIGRWHRPDAIGTGYARMLADLARWSRAQVYGDEPWPLEPDKMGLGSLLERRSDGEAGALVAPSTPIAAGDV